MSTVIIPNPPQKEPWCSFCGSRKPEVTLIASGCTDNHICDKCVTQFKSLMEKQNEIDKLPA